MSDSNAPEPTMEEILASIRRIISEDEPVPGAPAALAEAEPAAAEPAAHATPEPEPEAFHDDPDEVLELTEPVREDPFPLETHGDLDVHAEAPASPPAPPPPPAATPAPAPLAQAHPEESLLSNAAASSAASSFSQLTQHVIMPGAGVLLEDVVRELLKPLLKSWLDANLPGIVQAKVDEEVERIARRRMG